MRSSGRTPPEAISETTPLLRDDTRLIPNEEPPEKAKKHARNVLVLVCIVIVAVDFGSYLSYAPLMEVYETIICRNLHGVDGTLPQGGGNSTSVCKSDDVQAELALVVGWMSSLNQLPGIFLALPFGFMADRIGRKPVVLLSLTGLILEEVAIRLVCWWSYAIPLRAIWATPLFQVLGGGPQIATSMAFTMISDVFPLEQRSAVFFILSAAILLGEILATPLGALAMSWNPWYPSWAGVAFEVIGLAAAFATWETLPALPKAVEAAEVHEPQDARARSGWVERTTDKWRNLIQHRHQLVLVMNLALVTGAFLMASIGKDALQFVIQYASKRFSWTLAQASLLITIKGIVNLVVLLLVLPQISPILSKHMSAVAKDLLLVQGSVCLLASGTALMAFATHPWVFVLGICSFALGWGFYSALRSLATVLVPPSQIGAINTGIALVQSLGAVAAGPVLASAFRHGMALGGIWMGLPYMLATILFVSVSCLIYGVRVPRGKGNAASS